MHQSCEVCAQFLPARGVSKIPDPTAWVPFVQADPTDPRTVALCRTHLHLVWAAGAKTWSELVELFRENEGRRSWLPRRQVTRTAHPGRRATDRAKDPTG
ncbi:MAG TPA: hypothetical protein VFQ61_22350 [Polyangiaceae bacterium]|nr:hypothetical protein [Polyangiaceae bacterium]